MCTTGRYAAAHVSSMPWATRGMGRPGAAEQLRFTTAVPGWWGCCTTCAWAREKAVTFIAPFNWLNSARWCCASNHHSPAFWCPPRCLYSSCWASDKSVHPFGTLLLSLGEEMVAVRQPSPPRDFLPSSASYSSTAVVACSFSAPPLSLCAMARSCAGKRPKNVDTQAYVRHTYV